MILLTMIVLTVFKRFTTAGLGLILVTVPTAMDAQTDAGTIERQGDWLPGQEDPIPVSISGFSGEVDSTIRFDLYVQGFKFVSPQEARFHISGSSDGAVTGEVKPSFAEEPLFPRRRYSGASLRRQAHAFSDDIVQAVRGIPGIAQTRIACKVDQGENTEIVICDFDGHGANAITRLDKTLAKSPAWAPDKRTVFYSSYLRGRAEIFRHDTITGSRSVVAFHNGSNLMPAASPDGTKLAMILSVGGNVDLYVADSDGGNLKQLTHTREEESSPCWSPDGSWICFATKIGVRRVLAKVSPSGGTVHRVSLQGVSNPSEPDWSPDGKWIAFTAQMGSFKICVVPADDDKVFILEEGDDPSWAPNSRTLVFTRRAGGRDSLSLLDVPTKQLKDVPRISGRNNSQPAWAR